MYAVPAVSLSHGTGPARPRSDAGTAVTGTRAGARSGSRARTGPGASDTSPAGARPGAAESAATDSGPGTRPRTVARRERDEATPW